MKLLTATFQQSQAITSTRAEEIIENIKEGSSLRRKYWRDYGVLLGFYFVVIIFTSLWKFGSPRIYDTATNIFYLLVLAQAVIATFIMLISSFYHNWIIEQFVFQSLMCIVFIVVSFIAFPLFYLAIKK